MNVESKIVTKFLLDTCRLRQPSRHHVDAAAQCFAVASRRRPGNHSVSPMPVDDGTCHIPLITGSLAEFYIQLMLPCVGDIDVMGHKSDQLAIPAGYPPPTELPAEFHSRVEVFEIIDSEYSGYVYLVLSYLLTEDSDTGKYNAVRSDERLYWTTDLRDSESERHGPAVIHPATETQLSGDVVLCVRCLSWPPQADDWTTRHRHYDWPDLATVDHVVNNGCDVVQVAHRLCKQDEWYLSLIHI